MTESFPTISKQLSRSTELVQLQPMSQNPAHRFIFTCTYDTFPHSMHALLSILLMDTVVPRHMSTFDAGSKGKVVQIARYIYHISVVLKIRRYDAHVLYMFWIQKNVFCRTNSYAEKYQNFYLHYSSSLHTM